MNKINSFSDRLKSALDYRDKRAADLSSDTKLNKSAISAWLNGHYEAKNDKIDTIAKYLNVSQLYLLGLQEEYGEYQNLESKKVFHPNCTEEVSDPSVSSLEIIEFESFQNQNHFINEIIGALPKLDEEQITIIRTLIRGMKSDRDHSNIE